MTMLWAQRSLHWRAFERRAGSATRAGRTFRAAGWILPLCFLLSPARGTCRSLQGTAIVPIQIEQNRVFVVVEFIRPDRTVRRARLWVDSGNPDFELSERLARDIGLSFDRTRAVDDEGRREVAAAKPEARIGRLSLDFSAANPMVVLGDAPLYPGMDIEGNLPSTVLKNYDVVFDSSAREMRIGPPGSLAHRGRRIPLSVQQQTGMVQTTVTIAGRKYAVALDNGAAYSIFSRALVLRWQQEHLDWPRCTGAIGDANMFGFPNEADAPMVRVPQIDAHGFMLQRVGAFAMPKGMFEWYSQKANSPVIGLLGGNVLAHLRYEIDYANHNAYFSDDRMASHDLDVVGIVLSPRSDGWFDIIGIASRNGVAAVRDVQIEDRLLEIDGRSVQGDTLASVRDSLRGSPGEPKILIVERDGRRIALQIKVARFL